MHQRAVSYVREKIRRTQRYLKQTVSLRLYARFWRRTLWVPRLRRNFALYTLSLSGFAAAVAFLGTRRQLATDAGRLIKLWDAAEPDNPDLLETLELTASDDASESDMEKMRELQRKLPRRIARIREFGMARGVTVALSVKRDEMPVRDWSTTASYQSAFPFVFGRITISPGYLLCPSSQAEAVLLHEYGHRRQQPIEALFLVGLLALSWPMRVPLAVALLWSFPALYKFGFLPWAERNADAYARRNASERVLRGMIADFQRDIDRGDTGLRWSDPHAATVKRLRAAERELASRTAPQ